jgi:hypothetical protein
MISFLRAGVQLSCRGLPIEARSWHDRASLSLRAPARAQREGFLSQSLSSERSAAWLAHQSGGLGVASSNLAAPTSFCPSFAQPKQVGSGRRRRMTTGSCNRWGTGGRTRVLPLPCDKLREMIRGKVDEHRTASGIRRFDHTRPVNLCASWKLRPSRIDLRKEGPPCHGRCRRAPTTRENAAEDWRRLG